MKRMKFFDTWTKRLSAFMGLLLVLVPLIWQGYGHFAKAYETAELRIRLDKSDLFKIQQAIFELEQAQAKRSLTEIESKRLQELKDQEREAIEEIRQQQRR